MSTLPPTATKPPSIPSGMDHDALPPGTRFGEFEILRVLGVGGFGIVYLAHDHSLEREVALKEYMPASLAARGQGPQITVRSSSFAETYAIGLRSFVNEARLLARFDHPSLVKVYRFWEDNATAYMVMPFLQGVTLRDTRRAMAHPPNEAWVRSVIWPLLSALELLHREGVFHRDIAPDNILLPPDGPPVLLDFGAARRVISDRTQSLTAILKPSYAPIEQYAEMVQMRQGPWTDLYALGAVIHFLLFGVPPAPATARAVQDDADGIENRIVPGVSPLFLESVAWMLSIRPNQRPQSGEELRAVLEGRAQIPPRRSGITIPGAVAAPAPARPFEATRLAEPPSESSKGNTALMPTHQPTANLAPPGAQRPTAFSPAAQMPTARNGAVPDDAPATAAAPRAAPPQGLPPRTQLPPTQPPPVVPAQARRDGGPASRPATLPPPLPGATTGAAPRAPGAAPSTRPAPFAAPVDAAPNAGPASAAAKSTSSKLPMTLAAGVVAVVIAAVAGWQLMARRDAAPADASAAASSPAVAAASAAPAPERVPPPSVQVAAPVPVAAPAPVLTAAPMPTVISMPPAVSTPTIAPAPVAAQASASARPLPTVVAAASAAGSSAIARVVPRPATRPASDAAITSTAAMPIRPAESLPYGNATNNTPTFGNPSYVNPPVSVGDRARAAAATAALAREPALRAASPIVETGPTTVREDCGKRVFLALAVCMDERCEQPRWRNTQECVSILARKAQRENR